MHCFRLGAALAFLLAAFTEALLDSCGLESASGACWVSSRALAEGEVNALDAGVADAAAATLGTSERSVSTRAAAPAAATQAHAAVVQHVNRGDRCARCARTQRHAHRGKRKVLLDRWTTISVPSAHKGPFG
jgi:hypothetical protein